MVFGGVFEYLAAVWYQFGTQSYTEVNNVKEWRGAATDLNRTTMVGTSRNYSPPKHYQCFKMVGQGIQDKKNTNIHGQENIYIHISVRPSIREVEQGPYSDTYISVLVLSKVENKIL